MKHNIHTFVKECDTYQCNKVETVKNIVTLQPLPIPPTIWTYISMYLIVGLPKLGNKTVIMVVVGHLSKYAHFYSLQQPFTTSIMAQCFMNNIFKLLGMSHSIVFYSDPTFTITFLQELFILKGTQLNLSTTYHSHIDGQSEAINKCLETYLRCFSSDRKSQWVQ